MADDSVRARLREARQLRGVGPAADAVALAQALAVDVETLMQECAERQKRTTELEKQLVVAQRSAEWHKQQAIAATIELGQSGKTLEEAVRATLAARDADPFGPAKAPENVV